MTEEEVGEVSHYFTKIGVAIVEVKSGAMSKGDTVHFKGATTDFTQEIASMQIEHEEVETANEGDVIGMKVDEHVRQHDKVMKIVD